MLLLSIVSLDEGEVCKEKEEARDAERGASSVSASPHLLKKKNTTTIIITAVSSDFCAGTPDVCRPVAVAKGGEICRTN